MSRLHEMEVRGQSPWIHGLTRAMLDVGSLSRLVDRGVRGAAMEPAEVGRAVADESCYDAQLRTLSPEVGDREAYFLLVAADARRACDALAPSALLGSGHDGWASAGIDPDCAHHTAAVIDQAARLYAAVGRRNCLVQVPATTDAVPAIEECTARGIPVEATLLYSARRHREAANAYLNGLRRLLETGGSPARIASVASFPLAWLDAEADRRLVAADGPEDLRGTFAVAHARLAYEIQEEVFSGPRWEELAAVGASPQYCRWAATTPSNLDQNELRYVEELIGTDSICTLSAHLLQAFLDSTIATGTALDSEVAQPGLTLDRFARAGVDEPEVARHLEHWSLAQLAAGFHETVSLIAAARHELAAG